MAIKRPGLALAAIITSMSLCSTPLLAQTRPAAHWSTFNKNATPCTCHLFAKDALVKEGLTITEDSGSRLIALNDQLIVEVACEPGGTQVFVSAFSSDSATAERARNNVRASIVKAKLFDTCP
jgi:hypothetical protein